MNLSWSFTKMVSKWEISSQNGNSVSEIPVTHSFSGFGKTPGIGLNQA
jgi:hypothetical protein